MFDRERLASFGLNPLEEAMLQFSTWSNEFTEHDREAMEDGLNTIRTAIIQPVGATPAAKQRNTKCVTDAEFDMAILTVVSSAMVMWLSGALEKVEAADA